MKYIIKQVKQHGMSMSANSTPVHQCIHTQAFSSPSNFLPQVLHGKDSRMKITPCVVAVEVLYVTSPIA